MKTMELRDGDRVIRGFAYAGEAYAYEQVGSGPKHPAYLSGWYRDNVSAALDGWDRDHLGGAFGHMAMLCARYLTEPPKVARFAEPAWDAPGLVPAAVLEADRERFANNQPCPQRSDEERPPW